LVLGQHELLAPPCLTLSRVEALKLEVEEEPVSHAEPAKEPVPDCEVRINIQA